MSLTKKPMKPMMAKPIAVAIAIFWNSGENIKESDKQIVRGWINDSRTATTEKRAKIFTLYGDIFHCLLFFNVHTLFGKMK